MGGICEFELCLIVYELHANEYLKWIHFRMPLSCYVMWKIWLWCNKLKCTRLWIMRRCFDVSKYNYQLGYQVVSRDEFLVILGANSIGVDSIGLWMAKWLRNVICPEQTRLVTRWIKFGGPYFLRWGECNDPKNAYGKLSLFN